MDPSLQPPPQQPPVFSATTTSNQAYPDSVDSSPRSRNTDSWDEPLPQVPGTTKLRLMCSYGGHIIPRPHDKSLCYIGGDTRIVVVDRHSSLSSLSLKLSRSLLNGRSFTIKYQLPNEDLDSLISISTDEDLENMIEEYDRTSSSSAKPSRLRLFLFLSKPETASSMGSLLDDSKSESWFVDALNGAVSLPRGFSADSASVNCLLGLDEIVNVNRSSNDVETQSDSLGNINKQVKSNNQDVQSVPDSPMMGTSSSFGSTSSSPSMSNLPPIRVRIEDQKVGLEEHFSQMNVIAGLKQQQEESFVLISSPPPLPTTIMVSAGAQSVPINSSGTVHENPNKVFSDDERSDYGGVSTGFRKPLQQTQPQLQQKTSGGIDLIPADGTGRDNSFPNMINRPKQVYYQEQVVQQVSSRDNRVAGNPIDPKRDVSISDPNYRIQIQQQQEVHESGYSLSSQLDQKQQQQQHQFIQATGTHYIQNQGTGQVPIPSYYHPMYIQQQQQLQIQHHQQQLQLQQQQQQHQLQHQHHHQMDQKMPMYFMPVHQTQPYNLPIQSNMNESTKVSSNRPPTPPIPTMISTSVGYKEQPTNLGYSPHTTTQPKPEVGSNVYRANASGSVVTPQIIHTGSDQQQHYVSYHQMHHPSQSVAAASAASSPTYAYEYSDPAHSQIYYTQPLTSTMPPSHYQTMNVAAAVAAVSEVNSQIPTENSKK